MALDFPNTPTLNQTFTGPNGTIWMWDGVKWVAITSTSTYAGQGNVGRNLLHNPLFAVQQRGTPVWTVAGYTADRWQIAISLDTASVSVGTHNDAARTAIGDEAATFYLGNTFTGNAGATAFSAINQNIEDSRRLAGKTVTVSFWANASAALKLGVAFIQTYGSGGSPSAGVNVNGQAVTLSTTWTRYSVTIALPSASGKTFGTTANTSFTALYLIYSAGSSNATWSGSVGVQSGTINIWGVQLEIGSVATPLEKPDPQYDLSNCQRFYTNDASAYWAGTGTSGVTCTIQSHLTTTMRATPVCTLVSNNSFAMSGVNLAGVSSSVIQVSGVASATGAVVIAASGTASADL